MVRREQVTIAVIAVPTDAAQTVVDAVVAAGIKAVLNFSPGALQVPPDVKLKSVDLTVSLESLSFFLAQGEATGNGASGADGVYAADRDGELGAVSRPGYSG